MVAASTAGSISPTSIPCAISGWSSRCLAALQRTRLHKYPSVPGARVFACIPKRGYVGVGTVRTAQAAPRPSFLTRRAGPRAASGPSLGAQGLQDLQPRRLYPRLGVTSTIRSSQGQDGSTPSSTIGLWCSIPSHFAFRTRRLLGASSRALRQGITYRHPLFRKKSRNLFESSKNLLDTRPITPL